MQASAYFDDQGYRSIRINIRLLSNMCSCLSAPEHKLYERLSEGDAISQSSTHETRGQSFRRGRRALSLKGKRGLGDTRFIPSQST